MLLGGTTCGSPHCCFEYCLSFRCSSKARFAMKNTKDGGGETLNSPAKDKQKTKEGLQSPAKDKQSAKKRRKIAPDDGEVIAPGPAPDSFEAAHGEFTEAFDLTDISSELKQKMYAVAPVLLGREVVYTKEFFTDVVGLCGRGVLLAKLQGYEDEILEKWQPRNNRYEIAECLDSDEAASCADHWSKVYGESPDNDYFSMRFLRGCYANLVHNIDVNWAQEALDWRSSCEKKRGKNPKKLGPIALRQQIEAICKLVASIEANPDFGTKRLAAAKDELQQCQENAVKARNLKRRLLDKLKGAKESLEGCYADEEIDDLNARYSKIVAEAKTLRTNGTWKEASAKREEAATLFAAINESSEKTKKFEDTIGEIEEKLLPKAMAELKSANVSVEKAEERMQELTTCPVCKDAMAQLKNPADRAPSTNAPSLYQEGVANVDLPSPLKPTADAHPATSRNADGAPQPAVDYAKTVPADAVCKCTE